MIDNSLISFIALKIKKSISNNELEYSIKRSLDLADEIQNNLIKNEIVNLSQKYYKTKYDFEKEFISLKDKNTAYNKIIYELLGRIDSIVENNIILFDSKFTPKEIVFIGKNLCKDYETFRLNGVDIELCLGEILGVVGPNASGKTTLARIVAGELLKTYGEIKYPLLNQKNNKIAWEKVKLKIGYLPQLLKGWHGLISVKQSLHFEAAINGLTGGENKKWVNYIVQRLGLFEFENFLWSQLSSGYKLRFSIAKLLVSKPKLVILDEPLANLDLKMQIEFLNDIKMLANSKMNPFAVLVTSQHIPEIEFIANKMIFLENGTPIFNGNIEFINKSLKKNCFELSVSNSKKIVSILCAIRGLEVKSNGLFNIIYTPKEITANEIIILLINNGINITYFRDLSISTKSYLIKN